MKKDGHVKILKENLKQSAAKLGLVHRFVFQHNNDSKHTWILVRNYLHITDWRAQNSDLLKMCGVNWNPSNLEELERLGEEEWAVIGQEHMWDCWKLQHFDPASSSASEGVKIQLS